MNRRHFLYGVATGASALALWQFRPDAAEAAYPYRLTDAQWRSRLSPWAYKVLRQGATEFPDSSPLNREHRAGTFTCAGCAQNLFSSKTKFDSGTGWPSFYAPLPRAIGTSRDFSLGVPRTEVHCARCGGHLGHVFDDGPKPTGLRYCMNGVALAFSPA
ncbi:MULTISPECIES: peptide-methionine (R)-S-oxide reductase MsrB [Sphingobium]|jgi:peptide-methionine (R)-S-oxide reductase|uniref:peptide-methionine (R)-S-oxide reductase n=3 Tax=Sphingobium yanoikuyae TaxID=13690 RepID=K9D9R3_SPHYA|nr:MULTISPECIES: peptide-methionine (R)-S-oxide reductase MsrB [Sphingobium]EKU74270.1 methionine-R-sulfoxide reductase [Sphingobium yanoikuyae ATCC 51230]MDG2513696.1 peptide-methionine (R)-S-oxide reductase MsrB [Sphingobium yanoikuyae]QCB36593.1 peptide-methionine (R)-S-oxide reductase [Sphingobium sp. PAMC28499]QHD68833.1 peptide-methionine (R)-S-oxide reductase MsrB [Sphingobium yanoikuyae]WQE06205.1 peptide-methionine (R)-S-oxide reductase MsrB [Sphingobium yanoikuyae]